MSLEFAVTYEKAAKLFEAGRYPEAEDLYLKLIAGGSGYADIYNQLGLITAFQGQIETAVEWFHKAVEANPRYTEACLNLAVTCADLSRYDDAQQAYDDAARLVRDAPVSTDFYVRGRLANEHAALGDRYANLGLHDEALDEYRKALGLCPTFPDIVTKVGVVLREQGAYDEAIRVFLRAKEISPDYLPASIHLGITYYMSGFPDLAREEWESIPSLNGDHTAVYLSLAKKDLLDPGVSS